VSGQANLEAAIRIALHAHAGQVDKAGQPYILHPLRVMMACSTIEQRIVAVLHDVVEDSGHDVSDIEEWFGDDIALAVDALTRRSGETYTSFIRRCAENPLARYVKNLDLADNMDLARLGREPNIDDARRQQKYAGARGFLLASAATPTPGDPQ
jgi:GTP diphosphokinase / guanosine-3',5'-bis(diphosphate) 3'-diphosphatase